jgi:murein DD-endopeptidase MepM/ murein hydrolase activator NlpD
MKGTIPGIPCALFARHLPAVNLKANTMMKLAIAFAFALASAPLLSAQDHIKVTEETDGAEIVLFIENSWFCPYTVDFEVELNNARANRPLPIRIVVPANGKAELVRIQPKPNTKWGYRYNYSYTFGDAENARHDDDYVYQLPYQQGKTFFVGQGYNGPYSHKGEKAIDFVMPEGTPICAAREGIVIKVKQDSNRGCASASCKEHGNLILIYHPDGSIANYAHLRHRGSAVKEGDTVKKGQIIGYSGNTGWSSAPHLHFDVYVPGYKNARTGATTFFQTSVSDKALLEEKKSYGW